MACATPPFGCVAHRAPLKLFFYAVYSRVLLFFTCLFLAFIFMFVFVPSAYDCVRVCVRERVRARLYVCARPPLGAVVSHAALVFRLRLGRFQSYE